LLSGSQEGLQSAIDSALRQENQLPSHNIAPVAESLFDVPRPTQTLAQFLGSEPPRIDTNWQPDEIPDLTNVDEIVLNFATDGLDWTNGAQPIGVTVATLDGQLTRFLPFGFKYGGNLPREQVIAFLQSIRGKKIYNDNTRFDMHMGRVIGADFDEQGCTFSDIQHTVAIIDDSRGKFRSDGLKPFAIDTLALDYLPNLPKVQRVDERAHAEHHASEVAERERFTADLVWRLRDILYPELDKQELRAVQRLEDDVIPAVVEMEKNGSPLDIELLHQYHAECNQKHDELMWGVSKECGFAFEHTAKGWQRLFEALGLPSTDGNSEAIIEAIDHPLVKKAHLAAQYASLDSKTFKPYIENVGSDGILRFDINQLKGDDGGTVSGRFSIGYVQQVPNADNHGAVFGDALFPRRLFVPASGDYLEADAMQIEQRLLVHYMDNAKIIKEYEDDYDRLMRGEEPISFHKIMWALLKQSKPDILYSHTKSFDFAKQYGARSIKLAVMMEFITEAEGDEIRRAKRWDDPRLKTIKEIEAAYKQMVPEGDALLDLASHLAKPACDEYCKRGDALHRQYPHRGYVKTLAGRRSRFATNHKTYIGLNRVLQGTGADIMKQKLVELHRERKRTGFVMRLTVHDAVSGDATLLETKQRVGEILNRQSYALKVPILWSTGTGRTWADCK
jgi:DNA polymerase I-like protein with 3'-5' exonuclease and polymerase domains